MPRKLDQPGGNRWCCATGDPYRDVVGYRDGRTAHVAWKNLADRDRVHRAVGSDQQGEAKLTEEDVVDVPGPHERHQGPGEQQQADRRSREDRFAQGPAAGGAGRARDGRSRRPGDRRRRHPGGWGTQRN